MGKDAQRARGHGSGQLGAAPVTQGPTSVSNRKERQLSSCRSHGVAHTTFHLDSGGTVGLVLRTNGSWKAAAPCGYRLSKATLFAASVMGRMPMPHTTTA